MDNVQTTNNVLGTIIRGFLLQVYYDENENKNNIKAYHCEFQHELYCCCQMEGEVKTLVYH